MAKKQFYFNKSGLAKVVGKVNAEYLFLAGQTIKSRASQLLKPGDKASKAGEYPTLWKNNSPLKTMIRYALDPIKNSIVVGSMQIGNSTVPGILNYGGTTTIKVEQYKPRNRRKWGAKHYEGSRPRLKRPIKGGSEYYSYFRSKQAWENARNSSGFQRWGREQQVDKKTERLYISPRPYMTKALSIVCSSGMSAYLYKKAVERAFK